MTKTLSLFFILFFTVCFANAASVDPEKKIDPEKREKEAAKEVVKRDTQTVVVSEGYDEEYRAFLMKDQMSPVLVTAKTVKPKEEKPPAAEKNASDEVQSFNFLYYIIHHFKFSDFITE